MKYQEPSIQHCELNPIELIWVQVKGFVTKNNTTFRLKDVKELMYAAFEKLQKMCGQKQNMWSKLKKNTAKKTVQIEMSQNYYH